MAYMASSATADQTDNPKVYRTGLDFVLLWAGFVWKSFCKYDFTLDMAAREAEDDGGVEKGGGLGHG